MPSPTKHKALVDAGFSLAPICLTCSHWQAPALMRATTLWSRCGLVDYVHEKHGDMTAGTPLMGTCPSHELDLSALVKLAGDDYSARYAPDDKQ